MIMDCRHARGSKTRPMRLTSCSAFAFAALLLAPLATLHAASPVPSKPNIIVILVDDMGWADIGVNGSKFH